MYVSSSTSITVVAREIGPNGVPEKVSLSQYFFEFDELDFEIEIDGGATLDNVQEIIDAGVEIVVAGSAVFKAEDITETTKKFKEILEK